MSRVSNAVTRATKWLEPFFDFLGVTVLVIDPEKTIIALSPDDAALVVMPGEGLYKFASIHPVNQKSDTVTAVDFTNWLFNANDDEVINHFNILSGLYQDEVLKNLQNKSNESNNQS